MVWACFKLITLNGNIYGGFATFEPADGRVCRAPCPTLASCTHVLFDVHVHVNSVYPTFGSEMHIPGSYIFPGSITSL